MRVLIVGCGYVGLELGRRLASHGHEVHGIKRSRENEEALREAGVTPWFADITRPDGLHGVPTGFDWVVHSVAAGGKMDHYQSIYLDGTNHLLHWLEKAPPQKLVYTSSTSVYGQEDGSVVDENSPTEPITEPAQVLAATERRLLQAASMEGPSAIPAVILRLAGIYGPGRGFAFKTFLRGQARMEGEGNRIMNMIHREDVVGCIHAALQRGRPGEVYNAVDHEPVTQAEFFRWLSERTGRPMPPGGTEAKARRRGNSNKRVCGRKLRTELEYSFRHPDFRSGYSAELDAIFSQTKA